MNHLLLILLIILFLSFESSIETFLDLLFLVALEHLDGDIFLMDVDRHERLDLLAVHLGA